MTTKTVFIKDPDAILDWRFDWKPLTNSSEGGTSDWLGADETISTDTDGFAIIISPSETGGLQEDSSELTDAGTSVTVWLSGGEAGQDYTVTCRITTTENRTDDRSITVKVRQR